MGKEKEPIPTSVLLGRVAPIEHVSTTIKIEPKATNLSPVIPVKSETGGEMSQEEKAEAQGEAVEETFKKK